MELSSKRKHGGHLPPPFLQGAAEFCRRPLGPFQSLHDATGNYKPLSLILWWHSVAFCHGPSRLIEGVRAKERGLKLSSTNARLSDL